MKITLREHKANRTLKIIPIPQQNEPFLMFTTEGVVRMGERKVINLENTLFFSLGNSSSTT